MCICETAGNLVFDNIKYLISALISHTQALAKKEKKTTLWLVFGCDCVIKAIWFIKGSCLLLLPAKIFTDKKIGCQEFSFK